jgi:hypothetical protein
MKVVLVLSYVYRYIRERKLLDIGIYWLLLGIISLRSVWLEIDIALAMIDFVEEYMVLAN